MARHLSFEHAGAEFSAELVKVSREHLYGSVRVLTRDANDQRCFTATLASDGRTLIPKGGTALGYINTEGDWIERSELQAVSLEGEPLAEVPSSFDAPIRLERTVDETVLLDHSVRLCYRLAFGDGVPELLRKALDKDTIFQFGFSYRGGLGHDPAFIYSNDDAIWMLVTDANDIDYVSLEQAALCGVPVNDDETDDGSEDDDGLDFGML